MGDGGAGDLAAPAVFGHHGHAIVDEEIAGAACLAEPAEIGDLESIVESIVLERIDFVKERGMGAMGPLMGVVMGACPGVDGKQVSAVLRTIIQRHS